MKYRSVLSKLLLYDGKIIFVHCSWNFKLANFIYLRKFLTTLKKQLLNEKFIALVSYFMGNNF